MMNGIDQDVQTKMNAYRGNPQALAQQYSQSQQLIDLLALQKLKSEKEAAARDMQMKMGGQGMPTVAESREQEVLDLTKQELAQQTTGAAQNQAQQKQQAMQQMLSQQQPRMSAGPLQGMSSPMSQGVGGMAANNMSPKAMAAGGIVAFEEGGSTSYEDEPSIYSDEEMRQRIANRGRLAPERAPALPSSFGSLANRGIRTLIGDRTPQEVYENRRQEGETAAGYSPEERAILQRQIDARAQLDSDRYNPDRRKSESLARFLLGGAGRTGIGSVLAGAGAANINYNEAMDAQERQAMVDRQKQEAGMVDTGPAARLAGMKLGTDAERTAMTGLAQGTGDAVQLEQLQAAAARAGISPEDKRITQAYQALNSNPEIKALLKTRESSNFAVDSPEAAQINQRIYEIAAPIFLGRKLNPDLFIPKPPEVTAAPTPEPGFWSNLFNSGALTPFGSTTQPPTAARRAAPTTGAVDTSNPLLR